MLKLLLRLSGWLPLPVLHGIGWLGGWIMWLIPNSQKRTATQQVRWCLSGLSQEEQDQIIRQSLIETAKAIVEAPAIWYGPISRLKRWIHDSDALEQMRERTQNGQRPAIFLTPHLGSWELTSFVAAQLGQITVLYKPQTRADGMANDLMNDGRARIDEIKLASTDSGGVRLLMAALKRKEMIGILPDHDPPDGAGHFAPFFGHPAHTMDLVSKLAHKTGAPVMFFVAERLPWAKGFRFHCIDASEGIDDLENGVAVMNKDLENCIMRWPGQYWWGYKRFRRLPPGIDGPYKK